MYAFRLLLVNFQKIISHEGKIMCCVGYPENKVCRKLHLKSLRSRKYGMSQAPSVVDKIASLSFFLNIFS